MIHLSLPAYGRRYTHPEAVLADFHSGLDFRLPTGHLINRHNLSPGDSLLVHYHVSFAPCHCERTSSLNEQVKKK